MLKPEVESLVPGQTFNRRGFVKTALGTAFAAAALPVMAQAIKTDFAGLSAGEVTIPSGGFSMPAYRAQPEGKTKLPVVLVVSEIFGVHEYIADVCRRFAKLGYLAIAPELFARQGDPQSFGTIQELQTNVIAKVPDARSWAIWTRRGLGGRERRRRVEACHYRVLLGRAHHVAVCRAQ